MSHIKIIHFADLHFSKENAEKAFESIDCVIATGKEKGVDLFVIAGDLFDKAVKNTSDHSFYRLTSKIQEMLNIAPIVAVQGTPTHDVAGCYDIYREIRAKYNFELITTADEYHLMGKHDSKNVYQETEEGVSPEYSTLLILGCPEPQKAWFLKDKRIGKDEANEAIKKGMQNIFLGAGAMRKKYSNIPCLYVYHGSVEGASLCNGQNLPMGGLSVGRDDLALVGADYYALGHIHKPQQIEGLPAHYAGSAFPVNWGETEQKYFNYVEISTEGTKVHTIKYPHPPRKKIVATNTLEAITGNGMTGCQVWLELKAQKGQAFDKEIILNDMLKRGALPGSRVTVSIIPDEMVRAGNIQTVKSLREKVKIYADNAEKVLTPGVKEKADWLEQEARSEGLTTADTYIQIDRLILRGAIGIRRGLGVEEIKLNLNEYDPGLIALIGRNGAGKTTLIENMHPFSCLLTRAGKLQDHFYLRDSCRDLYFTDKTTGNKYRAYITIDGKNKSGGAEYYLYKNGEPITNGRKEDYDSKIQELFGSLSLFLRSVFVPQKATKNNPDLSEATKGEKKAIFRELAGLDYLQAYADKAKEKANQKEDELIHLDGQLTKYERLDEEEKGAREGIEIAQASIEINIEALRNNEDEKDKTEARRTKMEADYRENQKNLETLRAKRGQCDEIQSKITALDMAITKYKDAASKEGDAQKAIDEAHTLRETIDGTMRELMQKQEANTKVLEARHKIEIEIERVKHDTEAYETNIIHYEKEKAGLLKLIDSTVKCPKCGHEFNPEADNIEEIQQRIVDIDIGINGARNKMTENANKKAGLGTQLGGMVMANTSGLQSAMAKHKEKLARINVEQAKKILELAKTASVMIAANKIETEELECKLYKLEKEIKNIPINAGIEMLLDGNKKALEMIMDSITENKEIIAAARADENNYKKMLVRVEADKKHRDEIKAMKQDAQQEKDDWLFLVLACGADGIQALELDALAPSISAVANTLLDAAYGSQFRIAIDTTRIAGKGSMTKQVEDFLIKIISEDGDDQELSTLSGGEAVWIKKAVYDAFGIIRANNTGLRFLTAYQDEADGELDPASKGAYFKMLEAAHIESGRTHTILITHSPEAQEMIAQKIEMTELAEQEGEERRKGK